MASGYNSEKGRERRRVGETNPHNQLRDTTNQIAKTPPANPEVPPFRLTHLTLAKMAASLAQSKTAAAAGVRQAKMMAVPKARAALGLREAASLFSRVI